jgi:hypothetical protein
VNWARILEDVCFDGRTVLRNVNLHHRLCHTRPSMLSTATVLTTTPDARCTPQITRCKAPLLVIAGSTRRCAILDGDGCWRGWRRNGTRKFRMPQLVNGNPAVVPATRQQHIRNLFARQQPSATCHRFKHVNGPPIHWQGSVIAYFESQPRKCTWARSSFSFRARIFDWWNLLSCSS